MTLIRNSPLARLIFFGNLFYGFCAVMLSVEASLQQHYPLNQPAFYILLFVCTVLYYTQAYTVTELSAGEVNLRARWYAANAGMIRRMQIILAIIGTLCAAGVLMRYWQSLLHWGLREWSLLLVFPFTAALYYGIDEGTRQNFRLRNIGWLKPFVIGFSWAGLVTVYPVLFYQLSQGATMEPTAVGLFLFIKNFMYVTVLCIMFDIKDYAMDYNEQLKTFVVRFGLRRTIYYMMIPLCIAGLASFLWYGFTHGFSWMKIILNTIPFICLILVAHSLHFRRTIFYYLIIIDGLMLLKACCGIIAMLFF